MDCRVYCHRQERIENSFELVAQGIEKLETQVKALDIKYEELKKHIARSKKILGSKT